MNENLLIGISLTIVLGIVAQWLAWRIHFPSILLLLLTGFAAGPATGLVNPDALFGELLFTIVSMSVGIILFEGGLNLRLSELRETKSVVRNLVSVGLVITWMAGTLAAYYIVGMRWETAVLLGAVLVVTGPTVIIPLLHQVKPGRRVGSILKWEGITIDPIGAVLAVLVFEAILSTGYRAMTVQLAESLVKIIVLGSGTGILFALVLIAFLGKNWVPDFLQNPVTLMMVIGSFALSNAMHAESGLLAVTVMGMVLANQKRVSIRHIIEFKENLRVLFIGGLFIMLSARITPAVLQQLTIANSLLFLGVMIFVARPVSVFFSTIRSGLSWREKIFLAWIAPRGIVAATVSSYFALELSRAGYENADKIVALTFLVIVGSVVIYGLTASPLAQWLRLSQSDPQGVLFVGAHSLARTIAKTLKAKDFPVLLVDTNWHNIKAARMEGCRTYYGSILSEYILDELDLEGIGRILALTPNDEANSLAILHFDRMFSSTELYQLPPSIEKEKGAETFSPQHLRGNFLFGSGMTYDYLIQRIRNGAEVKAIKITDEFDFDAFKKYYGETAIPLFLITELKKLRVLTTEYKPVPKPNQTIIALVDPVEENNGASG